MVMGNIVPKQQMCMEYTCGKISGAVFNVPFMYMVSLWHNRRKLGTVPNIISLSSSPSSARMESRPSIVRLHSPSSCTSTRLCGILGRRLARDKYRLHPSSKSGVSKLLHAAREGFSSGPRRPFLCIEEMRENYSYPTNPAKSCVTESYYYPSDYYQPRPGHVTNTTTTTTTTTVYFNEVVFPSVLGLTSPMAFPQHSPPS